jgi:hypothetical protein
VFKRPDDRVSDISRGRVGVFLGSISPLMSVSSGGKRVLTHML